MADNERAQMIGIARRIIASRKAHPKTVDKKIAPQVEKVLDRVAVLRAKGAVERGETPTDG